MVKEQVADANKTSKHSTDGLRMPDTVEGEDEVLEGQRALSSCPDTCYNYNCDFYSTTSTTYTCATLESA